MNSRIFTVFAVFAILIACGMAAVNLIVSASIIAGVLIFGIGLLIYRIKFGP